MMNLFKYKHYNSGKGYVKLNNKGFSLVELVTTTAVLSVLSVFSITQYKKHTTRSRIKEAKIQLGQLHSMENLYFLENRTYTFQLKGNMFPKGRLLYNVGFSRMQADRFVDKCACTPRIVSSNYYQLCGDDLTTSTTHPRKECGFKSKKEQPPKVMLKNILSIRYKHSDNCNGACSCGTNTDPPLPYTKYVAYAVGDILSPYEFENTTFTNWEKLDMWRINGNGYLEHCNDPLDTSTPNNCGTAMKQKKGSTTNYCS